MLPPPTGSEQLRELQNYAEGLSEAQLADLPPPTQEHFSIFGSIIQSFNYADLNLRRLLEALVRRGHADKQIAGNYKEAPSFTLVPAVMAGLESASLVTSDQDGVAAIRDLEMLWPHRNIIAHWAARRFTHVDALIFMTKDGRDYRRMHGTSLPRDEVMTAYYMVPDLRGMTIRLWRNDDALATTTSRWLQELFPVQSE